MNRGLTLLEVIVSIMLMGILIAVACRFTSYGVRYSGESIVSSSRESGVNAGLVFIGQNLGDKVRIASLYGRGPGQLAIRNQLKSSERIELEGIFLEGMDQDEGVGFGLSFLKEKQKLFYYRSQKSPNIMECLADIESIYLEPIPRERSYEDAYGIRFIFKFKGISEDYELERSLYLKNHEERAGCFDE